MPLDNPIPPRIVDVGEIVWLRSQRVLMQVGVRVSGADALGNNFEEYTETLAISAHGALVLLANRVTSSAKVLLRHNKTEEEQECHVAYLGPVRGGQGGNRFGVFLASPHVLARGFSCVPGLQQRAAHH